MIDLHAHILPGVDDGPQSATDALALLRAMVEDGITTVVATPHMLDGRYDVTIDRMAQEDLACQFWVDRPKRNSPPLDDRQTKQRRGFPNRDSAAVAVPMGLVVPALDHMFGKRFDPLRFDGRHGAPVSASRL